MYQIIKTDGQTVTFAEELRYIKHRASSGAFVEADEDSAQGVAVAGTPYNLAGRTPLPGVSEIVSVILLAASDVEPAQRKAAREAQIAEYKAFLSDTDYIALKLAEALVDGDQDEIAALQNKYAPELAQRKAARATINSLQAEDEAAAE